MCENCVHCIKATKSLHFTAKNSTQKIVCEHHHNCNTAFLLYDTYNVEPMTHSPTDVFGCCCCCSVLYWGRLEWDTCGILMNTANGIYPAMNYHHKEYFKLHASSHLSNVNVGFLTNCYVTVLLQNIICADFPFVEQSSWDLVFQIYLAFMYVWLLL